MGEIKRVFISGFKYDVNFTRTCVSSIREYYPLIPITLIKDKYYGDFYTNDIEKHYNVDVMDVGNRVFSWGFAKLEPLFLPVKEKFLVLDSDTVILGKLLEFLDSFDHQFIVSGHKTELNFQSQQYYVPAEIEEFDKEFKHPGYGFNTGQFVATSGIFKREDFNTLVDFNNPPVLKNTSLFRYGEQGLLNYFLYKNYQCENISLKNVPFMHTGDNPAVKNLTTENIRKNQFSPLVIHWAGMRNKNFNKMHSGWILNYFEKKYYSKIKFGFILKKLRIFKLILIDFTKNKIKYLRKLHMINFYIVN